MSFEYLGILGLWLLVAVLLHLKFKVKLFSGAREIIVFYLIVIILGNIWDYVALTRGHWVYPGKGLVGIYVGILPIEDYVFAIVCPYFLLVLYKVISKQVK